VDKVIWATPLGMVEKEKGKGYKVLYCTICSTSVSRTIKLEVLTVARRTSGIVNRSNMSKWKSKMLCSRTSR
jgi:hypothetical protein